MANGPASDIPANEWDVVIVGLGPVGAAAANLCAVFGLKTLAIERAASIYRLPRAVHVDFEAMRILQAIGVADAFAGEMLPLPGTVYLGADGDVVRRLRARDTRGEQGWPASNLFYQPDLEAALRAAARARAEVSLRERCEFVSLTQDAGGVALTLRDLDSGAVQSVRARHVIACDGASSAVRKALGIALTDLAFDEPWLVVDALVNGPLTWPDRYRVPEEVRSAGWSLMLCDPRRPATLIPGPGAHRRWEFMLLADDPANMDEPAQVRRLMADWIDPNQAEIIRAAVYRFHGLVAERWRAGRVFLAGDAAHQTPPFYGQGLCHGLRDAANLIWKLAAVRDGADEALLDSYMLERRDHVLAIIRASIEAGAAVCTLDPARAARRDAEFRAAESAGLGVRAMTDVVPPLAQGLLQAGASGLAGRRFPQPLLRDARGEHRFDDFVGPHFALVGEAGALERGLDARARALLDRIGARVVAVSETHGLSSPAALAFLAAHGAAFALVRPDRYIFAAEADAGALAAALDALAAQLAPAVLGETRENLRDRA